MTATEKVPNHDTDFSVYMSVCDIDSLKIMQLYYVISIPATSQAGSHRCFLGETT